MKLNFYDLWSILLLCTHQKRPDNEVWVAAHNEQEALRKAAVKVDLPIEQLTVHQGK